MSYRTSKVIIEQTTIDRINLMLTENSFRKTIAEQAKIGRDSEGLGFILDR